MLMMKDCMAQLRSDPSGRFPHFPGRFPHFPGSFQHHQKCSWVSNALLHQLESYWFFQASYKWCETTGVL
ncbi:hypothetical protein RchiOBHm_Chr2g0169561 [Rosa chinensis]|uniref:Uncharacterized protein n=1 Tax=Rosa chinensis TaxID=74649 RepID=A0A2P6S4W2_ROSCH|nr:hypothetical protein RchiOBHm_Chr2g0169561 [Rosa chinensis]